MEQEHESTDKPPRTFILLAILLPLGLMVIFALATALPAFLVKPPQYDALFWKTENNYGGEIEYRIKPIYNELKLQARRAPYPNSAREVYLVRYLSESGTSIRIDLPKLPEGEEPPKSWTTIAVPELAEYSLDPSTESPDGYVYKTHRHTSSPLSGIFFSSSYRSRRPVLTKSGRSISIPTINDPSEYYYYYSIKFLGWLERE